MNEKKPLKDQIFQGILNGFAFVGFIFFVVAIIFALGIIFPSLLPEEVWRFVYEQISDTFVISAHIFNDAIDSLFDNQAYNIKINRYYNKFVEECGVIEQCVNETPATAICYQPNETKVRCFVQKVRELLFYNDAYIYEFNGDGEKNCQDSAVSFCYWMRKAGIECHVITTHNHVISLVRSFEGEYFFVDPSSLYSTHIKKYISGPVE